MESGSIALATAVAISVGLVTVVFLRKLALATDFVDRPGGHKSHGAAVPYLGGVAIMLGVLAGLAGLAAVDRVHPRVLVVIGLGLALGCVGLVDDRIGLSPTVRVVSQLLAATGAVAAGVQLHLTSATWANALATVVWIVLITNAFNLIDNMDGLAAGVATVSLLTAAVILAASPVRSSGVAFIEAGAVAAFLLWNVSPRRIFMGDAGSLFLGFTVVCTTIGAAGRIEGDIGGFIAVLLVMLPFIDVVTVVIGRRLYGRAVTQGGRDHLSHRLVHLGLAPRVAVGCLVGFQVIQCGLAGLLASGSLPFIPALVVSTALTALLLSLAWPQRVYDQDLSPGRTRLVRFLPALETLAITGLGAFIVLAAPVGYRFGTASAADGDASVWLAATACAAVMVLGVLLVVAFFLRGAVVIEPTEGPTGVLPSIANVTSANTPDPGPHRPTTPDGQRA